MMNIRSEYGTAVTFTGNGGSDFDVQNAIKEGLVVGKTYAVEYVEIHSWISYVKLEGIEGRFNTCMFD
jgi:hypothetical protein